MEGKYARQQITAIIEQVAAHQAVVRAMSVDRRGTIFNANSEYLGDVTYLHEFVETYSNLPGAVFSVIVDYPAAQNTGV